MLDKTESSTDESGVYEGNWRRDMRDGKGIMSWHDSSEFEGEWRLDMRFKGKMKMIDSTIYEGGFQNDKYHGRGKIMIKQT